MIHTSMSATVTFCGGTDEVTGSNFLLTIDETRILIDCGLTQGIPQAELRNWAAFPYDPKTIPFLIVTHAHLDHVGEIPKLVKDGFRGRIISTQATKTLAEPLLYDALELIEHRAQHHGKEALYDKEDIIAAFRLWEGISYHQELKLSDTISLTLSRLYQSLSFSMS